jgi:hypothetical protein
MLFLSFVALKCRRHLPYIEQHPADIPGDDVQVADSGTSPKSPQSLQINQSNLQAFHVPPKTGSARPRYDGQAMAETPDTHASCMPRTF